MTVVRALLFALCFFVDLASGAPALASAAFPAGSHADKTLTHQKDEILGTLSNLAGSKQKVVNKDGDVNVKIQDLRDAVKILENKNDRAKVIKALSALALMNQEASKNKGIVETVSQNITLAIGGTSGALINLIGLVKHIPNYVIDQVSQLQSNDAYRNNTYILCMILLTALLASAFVELIVHQIFKRLKMIKELDYTFRKIHVHVFRNTLPLILFGLTGYLIIYLSQPQWNIITYRGFIFMNVIIMFRSMWLLVSVLFGFKQPESRKTPKSQVMSFQFALAGIQTIIIGIIFGEVGSLLGMGELALTIWMKIIGLGVTSLFVIGLIRNRDRLKVIFSADQESLSGIALFIGRIVELLFSKAHIILGALAGLALVLWLANFTLISWFIAKAILGTAVLSILFVVGRSWIFKKILEAKLKLQLAKDTAPQIGLNYLEGSATNVCQAIWHLIFLFILAQIWGADLIQLASSPDIQPILAKMVSVLIILFIIRTLWGWADHIAQTYLRGRFSGKQLIAPSQFVKTVTPILNSVAHWFLTLVAVVLVLIEFGQDIRPIIYSLGVVGIAISLGAQSLVKDIINGVLTLMEGNIAVGEIITVGTNTGTVESLSLRSVVLRHGNGSVQTIPFSEVTSLINRSRDYGFFSINLLIPHKYDRSQAQAMLDKSFEEIKKDPVFGKMILEPMSMSGIDKITDTGINLTGSIKIIPDPQNRFGKVFNSYLQTEMEKIGFSPPASQKVLNVNKAISESDPADSTSA